MTVRPGVRALARTAAACGLLGALGAVGGCAAWHPAGATAAPVAGGAASAPAPAAAPALALDIDAPAPLKALLQQHLDVARLGVLAPREAVGSFELDRLIGATAQQARALLETEGYFEPQVSIDKTDSAAGPPRVRVRVQPGPQTRIGSVDLDVSGGLKQQLQAGDATARATLETLQRQWPLKPGDAMRNADWGSAKSAVLAQLRGAGYATATLGATAAEVNVADHSARLRVALDSGPLFRAGALQVDGLQTHERQTVLNIAHVAPGTPVTDTLLLDVQDRLIKAGLFESVAVTLEPDAQRAQAAPIHIQLTEFQRHQLTLGVGFSGTSGARASVEHIDRRFLGRAVTARNKIELAQLRQSWDGEISSHTRADQYRNLVGVTIERLVTNDDVVLSQRVRGGRAMESQRIERFYFLEFLRDTRTTSTARLATQAISANSHWIWRDIDNPLLPTRGSTLSTQLALGQAGGSGDGGTGYGPFARLYARGTVYRPIGGWYAQGRLELGSIVARTSLQMPQTLGFRAGGDESVRGYAYRTLGPELDGAAASGRVLMTASAEVARPFTASMPALWGAVFVDAGNAADTWRELQPAVGAGVGVRWRSPVGPLKLDLAYGERTRRVRLHFSVGIVF